jgi:peptide/nickel transport system substrate-binding protein
MVDDNTDRETTVQPRRKFLTLAGGAGTIAIAGCLGDGGDGGGDGGDGGGGDGGDGGGGDSGDGGDGDGGGGGDTKQIQWVDASTNQVICTEWDPAYVVDFSQGIHANMYDPLVFEDRETHQPAPHIAEDWEPENDTTWVFSIRDDVTFHSGNELTAHDVKYSFDRMMALERGFSSFWRGWVDPENGVEVRDDYTVAITTTQPYGPFVGSLCQLRIVDQELLQEHESDGDWGHEWLEEPNQAGSGPYQLAEFSAGELARLERYGDYWRGWEGNYYDEALLTAIEEESTVALRVPEGPYATTGYSLSTETYEQIADAETGKMVTDVQLNIMYHPINCQRPPFDDVKVREAVVYSYDYDSCIDNILKGGQQARGPVPRGMFGHNEDLELPEKDLERARAAIDDSGYTLDEINDIGVLVQCWTDTGTMGRSSQLLISGMQELGIEAEFQLTPWAQYSEKAANVDQTPQVGGHFNAIKSLSPDSHTYLMHHPDASGTYLSQSWFYDDELTALLEEARGTVDFDERMERYKAAQKIISDNYVAVFAANPPWRLGQTVGVEGTNYYGMLNWEQYYWDWSWAN